MNAAGRFAGLFSFPLNADDGHILTRNFIIVLSQHFLSPQLYEGTAVRVVYLYASTIFVHAYASARLHIIADAYVTASHQEWCALYVAGGWRLRKRLTSNAWLIRRYRLSLLLILQAFDLGDELTSSKGRMADETNADIIYSIVTPVAQNIIERIVACSPSLWGHDSTRAAAYTISDFRV